MFLSVFVPLERVSVCMLLQIGHEIFKKKKQSAKCAKFQPNPTIFEISGRAAPSQTLARQAFSDFSLTEVENFHDTKTKKKRDSIHGGKYCTQLANFRVITTYKL